MSRHWDRVKLSSCATPLTAACRRKFRYLLNQGPGASPTLHRRGLIFARLEAPRDRQRLTMRLRPEAWRARVVSSPVPLGVDDVHLLRRLSL